MIVLLGAIWCGSCTTPEKGAEAQSAPFNAEHGTGLMPAGAFIIHSAEEAAEIAIKVANGTATEAEERALDEWIATKQEE